MSNETNLIFSHITKTGGSSIEKCAKKQNILWGIFDEKFFELLKKCLKTDLYDPWHIPIPWCLDCSEVAKHIKNKKIFTVVRNPYERILSEYFCQYGNKDKNKKYNKKDLNNFVKKRIKNYDYRNMGNAHLIPQYNYVYDGKKKIIDHVIKFENLKKGFKRLMKKYNLPINLDEKANTSNKNLSIFDFDNNSIKTIRKIYYKDFIKFNYSFKLQTNSSNL